MERTVSPEANAGNEIVATVNGLEITRQAWQKASLLDFVMSEITYQPLPTAEETLDRLVNEILVMEAVEMASAPTAEEIEAKISNLATTWNTSKEAIVAKLEEAGLSERSGRPNASFVASRGCP